MGIRTISLCFHVTMLRNPMKWRSALRQSFTIRDYANERDPCAYKTERDPCANDIRLERNSCSKI